MGNPLVGVVAPLSSATTSTPVYVSSAAIIAKPVSLLSS